MKERPILFSGPMVRAILEGRKTQTRRVVKCSKDARLWPYFDWKYASDDFPDVPVGAMYLSNDAKEFEVVKCPYGQVGDRLWVKESFAYIPGQLLTQPHYFADGPMPSISERHDAGLLRKTSSLYMPRWASRITLEIVSIRVERLHDITEEDARAEGCDPAMPNLDRLDYVEGYAQLWESINGKDPAKSWMANPWVWVIEFKVVSK